MNLDCEKEVEKITISLRSILRSNLNRRGLVVALSGGIDSSVTLALCVKAVGVGRVVAIQMPEKHSADDTLDLSDIVADHFGVEKIYENITCILESVQFYQRYVDAVRLIVPEYNDHWKSKIIIPTIGRQKGFTFFSIVVQSPAGEQFTKRLSLKAYRGIVAATNFKQRIRKMLEYYHADRLNYAVTGTPNRLEYDQGFFVKLGDGAADVKPIAHLYKSQVYQLAEFIGIPDQIAKRLPTTDTYSLPQGQDEFYFSLPYDKMDLCLYAKNNGVAPELVGKSIGLTKEQVDDVFMDIDQKRAATRYLHLSPILVDNIMEI